MILCLRPEPSPLSLAISEELRNATASRDAHDIEAAIAHLRAAYALATSRGCGLGPEPCLRLPMYLQRAGRSLG